MRERTVYVVLLFLISYIAVLAVPIGFAFVLYDRALTHAETRSLESLTRIVANHGRLLDARIGEVRDTIDLVLVNAEVRSVFRDPANVLFRYRAARSLREFVMGSRFVAEVVVFFLEHDVLLSSQYSVTDPARFYGTVFRSHLETYSAFTAVLSQRSFAKEFGFPLFLAADGSVRRMESWIQTVSELESTSPAVVMVLVDHQEMQRAVGALVPLTGSAWLADASGTVVVTLPETEAAAISQQHAHLHRQPISLVDGVVDSGYVADGKLATVFTTMPDSGWTFHVSVPIDDDLIGVSSLRATFSVTTALAVLTGGLLSLILARRFGRPLGETLKVLETRIPAIGLGSVGSLRSAVQDVVHENQRHSDYISRNLPIIRTNLVHRVLTGSYRTLDELRAAEENAGISIQSESAVYQVAVIRIETTQILKDLGVYRELDRIELMVREHLYALVTDGQTHRHCRLFSRELEQHRIALLLVAPADVVDGCFRETVADLLRLLGEGREALMSVGCGRPVSDVLAVYRSLEEARHALDHAGQYGCPRVLSFSQVPTSEARWRYSLETEGRLVMALKAADEAEVMRLIDEVYEDNAEGAGDLRVRHLAVALRGTVLRVLNDPDYQRLLSDQPLIEELDRVEEFDSLDRLRDWASTFLRELLNRVADSRRWHQNELARAMVGYVNDHVFDPVFSFRAFADHFHLAEAAMSRLFKDLTGTTFSQYVEKMRMDHAHHLLTTTNRSVAEVATAVCYSSPQAFRRAFKRYFQSVPGSRELSVQRRL